MREQQQQPKRTKKLYWSRKKGECLDPRLGTTILDPKLKTGLTDREWCENLVDLVCSTVGTDEELRPNPSSILCDPRATWVVSSSHRFVREEYPNVQEGDEDQVRFIGWIGGEGRVAVWSDPKTQGAITVWVGPDGAHDEQIATIEVREL
jgi:hypothetical protein